jgi:glycosyltransferase involved in cell wall biosynthesis
MALKILIYHPVKIPVRHYGGTERVFVWLAEALQDLGHQVTVFAKPGSSMREGISVISDVDQLRKDFHFDVMHSFTKLDSEWDEITKGRILFTIHGNGRMGEQFHHNTNFLSQNHAYRHGSNCFVHNGLNPRELNFNSAPRGSSMLFLSKTTLRTKNLSGAIRICESAKVPLWIAGGERPLALRLKAHWNQFLGRGWRWVGSVDNSKKAQFLSQGRALLFPVQWHEPFGLAVVEALFSGTPVLATPHGSLPELLRFSPQCVLNSESEFVRAVRGDIGLPSAKDCYDFAYEHFHMQKMAESYVTLYEKILNGEKLNPSPPQTKITADEIGTPVFS